VCRQDGTQWPQDGASHGWVHVALRDGTRHVALRRDHWTADGSTLRYHFLSPPGARGPGSCLLAPFWSLSAETVLRDQGTLLMTTA
jgi:hypothetical protein